MDGGPVDGVAAVAGVCWFCPHLPFYPPWIAVRERRADLMNATRRG